jgi:hypothetical protein
MSDAPGSAAEYPSPDEEADALVARALRHKPRPIEWANLTPSEEADQLDELDPWVRWLVWRYQLDQREVPPAGPCTATSSKSSPRCAPPAKAPTRARAHSPAPRTGTRPSPLLATGLGCGSHGQAAASGITAKPPHHHGFAPLTRLPRPGRHGVSEQS